jgi:IPT/TIG domain
VIPGAVTIGGGLSVASVTPGGGTLPAGSVLQVSGTGFDSSTTVSIDGVAVASLRFINSQQIEATLGGATELTGKQFHFANPNGQTLDYFSAFPSAPSAPPEGFTGPTGIFPLTPLNVFSSVTTDENLLLHPAFKRSLAMQNQSLTPVDGRLTRVAGTGKVISELPLKYFPSLRYVETIDGATGVAVDTAGSIYTDDFQKRVIQRTTAACAMSNHTGRAVGSPSGIAADSAGNL